MTHQFAEIEQKLPFSARETEVNNAIAAGKSVKEVSEALRVPEDTIKNHVRNIIQKLRLFN
jgi:DNA-binding NarL/FixJ family response regulator